MKRIFILLLVASTAILNFGCDKDPVFDKGTYMHINGDLIEFRKFYTVGNALFKMAYVKGGKFLMGSDSYSANEAPAHWVSLSDFCICETEVTQKLWTAVMGTTIYDQRDKANPNALVYGVGANYPMYYVNYDEAVEFCDNLNHILSEERPKGYKFALPTEAQWEYAAHGGVDSKSYTYSGSNDIDDVAYYVSNSNNSTQKAGLKLPNELGLYDISGNVWEWCLDWYDNYSSEMANDPSGPNSGLSRVVRGGGFTEDSFYCRITYRCNALHGRRFSNVGFRIVLVKE